MRLITLSQGYVAIIDNEDYERVARHTWCAQVYKNKVYALRNMLKETGIRKSQTMHRFIMGVTDPELQVDHINHNGLDNRQCNLRVCTRTQNQKNQRSVRRGMSKYKGVTWRPSHRRWLAQIQHNKKHIHIGLFTKESDAAKAYDARARELFGAYACPNFPEVTA